MNSVNPALWRSSCVSGFHTPLQGTFTATLLLSRFIYVWLKYVFIEMTWEIIKDLKYYISQVSLESEVSLRSTDEVPSSSWAPELKSKARNLHMWSLTHAFLPLSPCARVSRQLGSLLLSLKCVSSFPPCCPPASTVISRLMAEDFVPVSISAATQHRPAIALDARGFYKSTPW